jgi:probable rRNA maturation factor
MTKIKFMLQNAASKNSVPKKKVFAEWVKAAFENKINSAEVGIRLVDEQESEHLNKTYRNKAKPTNILSFSYEMDKKHIEGDLVICSSLIEKEALELNIQELDHWAHIVVHGCLHLLGYTHETYENAIKMETLEANILQQLGVKLIL